ncbi:bifunctional enoyl-CoA hydratase/phosphate acetyltransferase [Wukongibacter baidiensis]|uniref:bifunctional enoyl-CoA hydratase/phosphate acetyltransferase n=1 Tax=Wukongibacter baidiensis TaxID=1723361 RepID=UPI003D7FB966
MVIKNFQELIEKVQGFENRKRVAVVAAADEHTLEAVFKAEENNIVTPVLIGDVSKIKEILDKLDKELDEKFIMDAKDDSDAAYKAVELIHKGEADFIMKGKIQTADLLKAVVDKEKGLRTGKVMTHFVINEVPTYHKLLVAMDGGMMMFPNLEEKKQIIEGAVNTLIALGYEKPKVAVLSAVEKVNPKMPDTVDAAKLKEMNQKGEIENCIVEGPISYDLTMSKESARIKGFESPVVGDADIILTSDIVVGNVLGKCLVHSAKAKMAGFIVGAKVPVVLTSRASSAEEKYLSLTLSAAVA